MQKAPQVVRSSVPSSHLQKYNSSAKSFIVSNAIVTPLVKLAESEFFVINYTNSSFTLLVGNSPSGYEIIKPTGAIFRRKHNTALQPSNLSIAREVVERYK